MPISSNEFMTALAAVILANLSVATLVLLVVFSKHSFWSHALKQRIASKKIASNKFIVAWERKFYLSTLFFSAIMTYTLIAVRLTMYSKSPWLFLGEVGEANFYFEASFLFVWVLLNFIFAHVLYTEHFFVRQKDQKGGIEFYTFWNIIQNISKSPHFFALIFMILFSSDMLLGIIENGFPEKIGWNTQIASNIFIISCALLITIYVKSVCKFNIPVIAVIMRREDFIDFTYRRKMSILIVVTLFLLLAWGYYDMLPVHRDRFIVFLQDEISVLNIILLCSIIFICIFDVFAFNLYPKFFPNSCLIFLLSYSVTILSPAPNEINSYVDRFVWIFWLIFLIGASFIFPFTRETKNG